MMSKTRKWIALLAAAVLVLSALPVAAEETQYISNVSAGSLTGFRQTMEIIGGSSFMLAEETLMLTTNEDYTPVWQSGNPEVAEVVEGDSPAHTVTIRAVAPGETDITAVDGNQAASFRVTVVNPEDYEGEGEKPEGEKAEGQEPELDENGNPVQKPELDENGNPVQKQKAVIVINGGTLSTTYTGEEMTFGEFEATSTSASFSPDKIKLNREIAVTATDCGYYMMNLTAEDFSYEDETLTPIFVVNDGYLKINPAPVTVAVNDLTKQAGEEDPELTATVTGLIHEEDVIEYTLARDEGEYAGTFAIKATGEEIQGNYRIQYNEGVFTILAAEGNPKRVTITSNIAPGEPAYAGTEIILTAHPEGFEGENYTLQWQRTLDLVTWEDIPGATDLTFTYILDEETAQYRWRVVATEVLE